MSRTLANLFVPVALMSSVPAASVSAQVDHDVNRLEQAAVAELKETGAPGAVVVAVSGNRALLVKAFGVANFETGAAVTTETLFRIGGMSKFLVTTVLLSLAEEGKLDLNVPIGTYVKGLGRGLSRVTAQQLLNETAGVKEDHLRLGLYDDAALGRIVRSWGDDWLIAEPGKIQSGSHPGYAVAGLLIEEIAGKPFAEVMDERLFSPLGMTRTTYRPLVAFTYPVSQGHRIGSGQAPIIVRPFALNSVGWPSYSLFSTANDLSRFLIAFLNGGKLDGRQIISPAVVALLAKSQKSERVTVGVGESYGLAPTSYGGQFLSGTYAWAGMRTIVRIVPDARFAIVILSNGGSPLRKTVGKATEMFLGQLPKPDIVATVSLPMTEDEISAYLGTYENEIVLTLFKAEGKLFIRDDTPQNGLSKLTNDAGLPVVKVGKNLFSVFGAGGSEPTLFRLIADDHGKIAYLHNGSRALRKRPM